MKFLWRRILGFVERQASFSDDVFKDPIIWSYYWHGQMYCCNSRGPSSPQDHQYFYTFAVCIAGCFWFYHKLWFCYKIDFSTEVTEPATHFKAPTSGAAIDVFPRGNEDAFMRNLHFLFILNIFFVILPQQLLIPSCFLFSSLTYSSCYSAIAIVGEDITASLMKRHRCYCKLSLLILL